MCYECHNEKRHIKNNGLNDSITNNFHTKGAEKDKELNHRTQVDADEEEGEMLLIAASEK